METITQQDSQNLSPQLPSGSGQDHIEDEEFTDPLASKTQQQRSTNMVAEDDPPPEGGGPKKSDTENIEDLSEPDPHDDLDQNSRDGHDLPEDAGSSADDLPSLDALDDEPVHQDNPALVPGPETSPDLAAITDDPEQTLDMAQGADELETTGGVIDTPLLDRSLRIDPSAFEIDVALDPAAYLQGSSAWKAYTSDAMSPDQKAAFEELLQSTSDRAQIKIGFANTDLGTEKNTQEKGEEEIQKQLTVDQESADKANKVEQYKTWKGRDKKITASKTKAASEEHKARKQGGEQERLERQSTQALIDTQDKKSTGEQGRLRLQSERKEQTLKSNARQRKREMVAKAEQEEKEKYWYEKAWDYVASAWERIKGAVTSMINYAWDQAAKVLRSAARAISNLANQFTTWADQQWDSLKQTCAQITAGIEEFVSQTWESAKQAWSDFRNECSRQLSELKRVVVTTLKELADDAQEAINDGIAYMEKRGSEILTSVNEGIAHAYSEAYYWWDRYEGAEMSAEEELFLTPEDRAEWLFRAVRGAGADTTMVLRCLKGNVAENKLLAAALKKNHGLDLIAVLKDELGGVDLAQAMDLVEGGKISLHNKILRAIGFWGADAAAIIALFESASDSARK